jgi:hypothetical protein
MFVVCFSVSESLSLPLHVGLLHTQMFIKNKIIRRKLWSLKLNLLCGIFFVLSDWWLLCIDRNISWYKYQGHENNCHI